MRRAGGRGYTLVEVLGAVAVLASLFVAVASLSVVSLQGSRTLHRRTLAMAVCGSLLADLRRQPDQVPVPASGTTTLQGVRFDWTVEVADAPDPRVSRGLKELTVRASWLEASGRHEVTHRTRMALPGVVNPTPTPLPSGTPEGPAAGEDGP